MLEYSLRATNEDEKPARRADQRFRASVGARGFVRGLAPKDSGFRDGLRPPCNIPTSTHHNGRWRSIVRYQCVAKTAAGFVQQLAVCYVGRGYHFYVTGVIPEHKDPVKTDHRILERYGIGISKWTRSRNRRDGRSSLQYLRHGRFFVLVATHGEHAFFAAEGTAIRDFRRHPLHFNGYAISSRPARGGGPLHPSVRISVERMRELKAHFARIATYWSVEEIEWAFRLLPFEPYAPVRDQFRQLLRIVNRRRKVAALDLVPGEVTRRLRKPQKPFGPALASEPIEQIPSSNLGGPNDLTSGQPHFLEKTNE